MANSEAIYVPTANGMYRKYWYDKYGKEHVCLVPEEVMMGILGRRTEYRRSGDGNS